MKLTNAVFIILIICGFIIGSIVGVAIGANAAINSCVSVGVKILERGNVSLLIDKEKIGELIQRYEMQVG